MYMLYPDGRVVVKADVTLTTTELQTAFGGWFYLRSAYNINGEEFTMCTKDLHGTKKADWPELNQEATAIAGTPIYGKALIAPAMSFNREMRQPKEYPLC